MDRVRILRALFIPVFFCALAVNVSAQEEEIKITLRAPSYTLEKGADDLEYFVIRNYGAVTSPGDPDMPVKIFDVMLPPDVDSDTVRLQAQTATEELAGQHFIRPVSAFQERPEDDPSWGDDKAIYEGKNTAVYDLDAFYPYEPVVLLNQSRMRKWKFVRVAFYPFQYNPVTGKLIKITKADVVITFDRKSSDNAYDQLLLQDKVLDKRAQERFINFKENFSWYKPPVLYGPAPVPGPPPLPGDLDVDYVIITTNDIRDNSAVLDAFVDHKVSQGHSVRVVTEDDYDVMDGQAPDTRAEKIREWLKDNYIPLHIKWVLLIGNPDPDDTLNPGDSVGEVPMKLCVKGFRGDPETEGIPTDFFYADLTGNWDLDGDQVYGEYNMDTVPTAVNNFSVRWTGRVQIDAAGDRTFRVRTDDGVRLWIDNELIIDDWTTHAAKWNEATRNLGAGQHNIKMEYFEKGGNASARLVWRFGGAEEVIPAGKLLNNNGGGGYVPGGLKGEYFAGTDFQSSGTTRVDGPIDFNWGGDGPFSLAGEDNFCARWTGMLNIENGGDFTLYTLSKDRVRLWVDDMAAPVIDNWVNHDTALDSAAVHMSNGLHNIKLDTYNSAGDAVAQLFWSYNQAPLDTMQGDNFSVRWTGRLNIEAPGEYRIRTRSDDGVRLWIDDMAVPVIDRWTDHGAVWDEALVNLNIGMHDIKMEFYEKSAGAVIRLRWTVPGGADEEVIPAGNLYYEDAAGSYVQGGLKGEYYQWSGADKWGTFKSSRIDPVIDFSWPRINREMIPEEAYRYDAAEDAQGIIGTYYQGNNFANPVFKSFDSRINMYWGTGDRGPDGVDFSPEVYVGRIPVYDNDYAQLDLILQKVIDYESIQSIPQWRRNLMFAAVYLFGEEPDRTSDYKLGEQLRTDYADPLLFGTYRAYEEDFGLDPLPDCASINTPDIDPAAPCNMLGELVAEDYGVVGWSTHGWRTYAAGLIDRTHAVDLDNAHPFFTFQGSCQTAWPEDKNNLSYALLKSGAICTVGATRNSSNYTSCFNPPPNIHDGQNCHLTYHYLMRIMNGATSGLSLYRTKEDVSYDSAWSNKMDYNIYGDPTSSLLTPYKIADVDVVLVLDHSGSMGEFADADNADKKIEALHAAADQFVDMLDAGTGNQLGIVRFSTTANLSMELQNFDADAVDDAHTAIAALAPTNMTSIGDGLTKALEQFQLHSIAGNRKIILLVTDGMENTAPLINQVKDDIIADNISVFSLGLGYSSNIDEDKLISISDQTNGDYRVTYDDLIFRKFFMEMLGGALDWDVAVDPVYTLSNGQTQAVPVDISCSDNEVYFTCYWSRYNNAARLTLVGPDGHVYDQASPQYKGTERYSFYRFDLSGLPDAARNGKWQMNITGQSAMPVRTAVSALVRSNSKISAGFDKQTMVSGKNCLLRAVLRNDGQPVTGAAVKAFYDAPAQWPGNLMYQNKVNIKDIVINKAEPLTLIQKKTEYLKQRLGASFISRRSGHIQLFDDGAHGDGTAGDGVYGAYFSDTEMPGTYTFRFMASGINVCQGDTITREWTRSINNPFVIDGVSSGVDVKQESETQYSVTAVPKDAFGNYAGPGYEVVVTVSSGGSQREVILEDGLDGLYFGTVILTPQEAASGVEISVTAAGEVFTGQLDEEQARPMLLWLILIIIILLLLLIIIRYFKK